MNISESLKAGTIRIVGGGHFDPNKITDEALFDADSGEEESSSRKKRRGPGYISSERDFKRKELGPRTYNRPVKMPKAKKEEKKRKEGGGSVNAVIVQKKQKPTTKKRRREEITSEELLGKKSKVKRRESDGVGAEVSKKQGGGGAEGVLKGTSVAKKRKGDGGRDLSSEKKVLKATLKKNRMMVSSTKARGGEAKVKQLLKEKTSVDLPQKVGKPAKVLLEGRKKKLKKLKGSCIMCIFMSIDIYLYRPTKRCLAFCSVLKNIV